MHGFCLIENGFSLRYCDCLFLLNMLGVLTLSVLLKISKKIGTLVGSMKFLFLRFSFIVVDLPYDRAWNTVAISRLIT